MAQANIPRAGRLNPRMRRAGGVGDTVVNLGFPELATDDISAAGKITVRQLEALRTDIVADVNLVLRDDQADVRACKGELEDIQNNISTILGEFRKVAGDIAEDYENGIAVINERTCTHKITNLPTQVN